jgi:hypothetical protein
MRCLQMQVAIMIAAVILTVGPFPLAAGSCSFMQVAQAQSRIRELIDRRFARGLPGGIAKSNVSEVDAQIAQRVRDDPLMLAWSSRHHPTGVDGPRQGCSSRKQPSA